MVTLVNERDTSLSRCSQTSVCCDPVDSQKLIRVKLGQIYVLQIL